MKLKLLILWTLLFGNIAFATSQENDLSISEHLKSMKKGDTLWIDIKKANCFGGNWRTIVVTTDNSLFDLTDISDVSELVFKYDKKAILNGTENIWIQKNFEKIKNANNSKMLKDDEYHEFIDSFFKSMISWNNCSTDIAGQRSAVEIKFNNIKEEYNYDCEIYVNF